MTEGHPDGFDQPDPGLPAPVLPLLEKPQPIPAGQEAQVEARRHVRFPEDERPDRSGPDQVLQGQKVAVQQLRDETHALELISDP